MGQLLAVAFEFTKNETSQQITQMRNTVKVELGIPSNCRMLLHSVVLQARYRMSEASGVVYTNISDLIYGSIYPIRKSPPGRIYTSSGTLSEVGYVPLAGRQTFFGGVEVAQNAGDMEITFELSRNNFVGSDIEVFGVVVYEFQPIEQPNIN